MGIDIGRARRALGRAGGPSAALLWPFGRERRAQLLLQRRLAVLDAKNAVADILFGAQKPLTELQLSTLVDVERALTDPEKRRLVVRLGVSREVIEDELKRRPGSELGRSLDQALSELIAEGYLLQVPGPVVLMRDPIYIAVLHKKQPHYEVAELNRLVREGSTFLKDRARRHDSTTAGRQYRL